MSITPITQFPMIYDLPGISCIAGCSLAPDQSLIVRVLPRHCCFGGAVAHQNHNYRDLAKLRRMPVTGDVCVVYYYEERKTIWIISEILQ